MTSTTSDLGFRDTINSLAELTEHYRRPSKLVQSKATPVIDEGCRDFIASSTFVLVGTASAEGYQDVSPKGGPAGFVKVLDEKRLVIPDMNGNNRLDSLRNIVENPRVGLLFLIPGLGETLRINGGAYITTDPDVLDVFADELRRPKTAIGVTVDEGYIHCAKAFRRGGMWTPDEWPATTQRPSVGKILIDHAGYQTDMSGQEFEDFLEASYVEDLAADTPE